MTKINQEVGCVVGGLMIMFYFIMIFCEMPFSIIWFLPIIYCFVTSIASLDPVAKAERKFELEQRFNDQNQYKQQPIVNSYVGGYEGRNEVQTLSLMEEPIRIEPAKSNAQFCQNCGTGRVKGANYCFQCGAKLE